MESYFFNKEVVVDAVYFKHQNNNLTSYPKRAVIDGESVTFRSGQQHRTLQGAQAINLFEMTDGKRRYRLALDQQAGAWKLLRIATIGA